MQFSPKRSIQNSKIAVCHWNADWSWCLADQVFFKWHCDFTELYNLSISLGKSPTSAQTPAVTLRWTAMMSSRRQEGPVVGGGMWISFWSFVLKRRYCTFQRSNRNLCAFSYLQIFIFLFKGRSGWWGSTTDGRTPPPSLQTPCRLVEWTSMLPRGPCWGCGAHLSALHTLHTSVGCDDVLYQVVWQRKK